MNKKLLTIFFSLILFIPHLVSASTEKIMTGKIINDSPWSLADINFNIRWVWECGFGDGRRNCNEKNNSVQIKSDGSFSAKIKTGSKNGIFGREVYFLTFSFPNTKSQQIRIFNNLPIKQDIFIKYIRGSQLNVLMANNSQAKEWLNETGPEGTVSYDFVIRNELTNQQVLWFNKNLTGDPIEIENFLWVTTDNLKTTKFKFEETVKVPNYESNFFLFKRFSSGLLNQNSFSQRLGPIVLNIDGLNTSLSGQWSSLLLLHQLGPDLGFAVANTRLNLNLSCNNGILSGVGQHFHFQNKYDYCFGNEPCEEKLVDEFQIKGICRDGRGEFDHIFNLKKYLAPETFKYPLRIKFFGVTNGQASARAFSLSTEKHVGYYTPKRY